MVIKFGNIIIFFIYILFKTNIKHIVNDENINFIIFK